MKRFLAVLATVMAVAACGNDTEDPAGAPGRGGAGCDPPLAEAFDAWGEAGFSGSIAVATGGEFDCLAAYGEADQAARAPTTPDHVFSIGSVSKAVTAAAVFALVDDGRLALDDRAGDHVDGLAGPVADATVEQLLLHTSGLTGSHGSDHEPLDRDGAVRAIGGLELAFAPGSVYQYSNAGYTLLALIVEGTSGTSYRDFVASEALRLPGGDPAGGFWDGEPAAPGPRAIGYLDDGPTEQMGDFPGPHWALAGNGDVAMTMSDLATWARALFEGDVVSPASAEAIATPGYDHGDGTAEVPGWVALDAASLGERAFAAAGGGGDIGHDVVVAWLPESERAVAIASNTPDVTAEALLQAVGPALVAGDPLPTPPPTGDADPADLAAAEGGYELAAGGRFDVAATAEGDGLDVVATGADAVAALFPPSDGFTAADLAAHEDGVRALLAGEGQEGQAERAALESDFGPIEGIEVAGTVVAEGELHTYVTVTAGGEPVLLWYALDDAGGIAAAEASTGPPRLRLVPTGDGAYRPDDPTGTGPDVTVAFDGRRLTITGPAGTAEAVPAS